MDYLALVKIKEKREKRIRKNRKRERERERDHFLTCSIPLDINDIQRVQPLADAMT